MSRKINFQQFDWLIKLSPRKNVEPRIVGIRPTFAARHFPAKWRSGLTPLSRTLLIKKNENIVRPRPFPRTAERYTVCYTKSLADLSFAFRIHLHELITTKRNPTIVNESKINVKS